MPLPVAEIADNNDYTATTYKLNESNVLFFTSQKIIFTLTIARLAILAN